MAPPRKFDHDWARRMYATGDWTITELARWFDVAGPTIKRAVDPDYSAYQQAAHKRRYTAPCIEGCGNTVWLTPGRGGRCPTCEAKRRQVHQHGTSGEYKRCRARPEGACDECKAWAAEQKRKWRAENRERALKYDSDYKFLTRRKPC